MQVLDLICLAGLAFSLLVGAWRGLVVEVLSVMSWIAAFFLAQWLAPDAAQWLPLEGATEVVRYAAGFVLVFIATVFFGSLLAFVIKKLLTAVGMRPADRVLGAAFGLVRGVVMILALTVVVGMTSARAAPWWQDAVAPQVATVVLQGLKPVLPQEFGKYLP